MRLESVELSQETSNSNSSDGDIKIIVLWKERDLDTKVFASNL